MFVVDRLSGVDVSEKRAVIRKRTVPLLDSFGSQHSPFIYPVLFRSLFASCELVMAISALFFFFSFRFSLTLSCLR